MIVAKSITTTGILDSFPGVAVDRREQDHLRPHAGMVDAAREVYRYLPRYKRTLRTGDYGIVTLESWGAVEWKATGDAVSTLVGFTRDDKDPDVKRANWDRFSLELDRGATELTWFSVLIECSREDILQRRYMGGAHPHTVLARADSIITDWSIPVLWAGTRREAERWLGWTLVRKWEEHLRSLPEAEALGLINAARERKAAEAKAVRAAAKLGLAAPVADPREGADDPAPGATPAFDDDAPDAP